MEQPKVQTAIPSESDGPIKDQNPNPNPNPTQNVDPKPVDQEPKDDSSKESKIDQAPARSVSGSRKSVHWNPELVSESQTSSSSSSSNPYIARSPPQTSDASLKDTIFSVKDAIGRWGRRVGEAAMKAESLAGNTWQHLKTAPSFADAAMGRIAQSTKVFAEGGYEKIFRQTFETGPDEHLLTSYACYLSTSAGPVMGVLYISNAKLAYCSDNPLSYKTSGLTEWSYYKIVIPLHQLKSINPSANNTNPAEKYIQVISVDDHEFWFMGFLYYDEAVTSLENTLQAGASQSV